MALHVSVVILLVYVVVKCIVLAAVPIDSSKIDFEKVNRDMRKPKFPFEPDFRQKPAQISQAHEVLRLALRSFLDLKDANLSFYLNEMRKTNESYLDEFGNEIKGYRTIFSLVLKQVDEVENNNYAVNHFEGDKYDLCSISKYLSHQKTFSDRQNIMAKMGEALGSECDPSMPYKRKLYGNPASASVNNQEPEKKLPNISNKTTIEAVPSHFPAETDSEDSEDYIDDEEYLAKLCNHQSLDVYIRNSNTKEFLYAAADYIALDTLRRRVFTWKDLNDIPEGMGNAWTGEETWRIEPVDKYSSNSFRVKNIRNVYGPREYLFANSSGSVYVRRGLPDKDSAVLTLGSSAKWQLLAKVADELRGDLCNLDKSDIRGFVLRNEKYALGFLNAEEDDTFDPDNKNDRRRRNVKLSLESPSYWDILPLTTYVPVIYLTAPPQILKDGHNGASKKWDMNNYTFFLLVTTLMYHIFK